MRLTRRAIAEAQTCSIDTWLTPAWATQPFPAFRGGLYETREEAESSRRGGGGWDEGRERLRRPRPVRAFPTCQGDASVPSPHNPTPAPTGRKALPRRHHAI